MPLDAMQPIGICRAWMSTWHFDVVCIVLGLCLAGCARSTSIDESASREAGVDAAPDAASVRDGAAMDAPVPESGPPDGGVDAHVSDAGMYGCPTHVELVCDGISRAECYDWAYQVGPGYTDQSAVLICNLHDECVRANYCSDQTDASTCQCGDGPPCHEGQVCARRSPTSRLECLPCRAG